MKKDILYFNTLEDIKIVDMLRTTSKDKELPNLIILTILSAGAGLVTPIFSKDASGTTVFSSIDEIGTKFILDGKEVTSDDFLVVTKSQYGTNYNFFGLLFEDSNEHTLKVSLVNSTINQNTFQSNNYLTKVIIGTSITSIGDWAFSDCTSLTSVTIPDSVTSIGAYTFYRCTGLTSVTIPNLVTEIGDGAFSGCSGLTSITSLATTAPTIYSTTFQNIETSGTLHVPAGSDYSAWMSTSNYYLGKYNWTKVEDA